MARLSYQSSTVVRRDGMRQVCLAVSLDGKYRIVRSNEDGQMTRLQGTMPKEQVQQLQKLLNSSEFRSLSGHHGPQKDDWGNPGLIRGDAESFAAEIPLGDRWRADGTGKWMEHESRRVQWLNADDESPFPDSVAKIVDWLERFQPKGKPFVYTEFPDICPSVGLSLVQPTLASTQP